MPGIGMPGLGIFALVTVLIAAFTYLAVFNLNNMVELGRISYESYKKKTVKSTKEDQAPKWKARATELEYFRPKRTRLGPTAWPYLLSLSKNW